MFREVIPACDDEQVIARHGTRGHPEPGQPALRQEIASSRADHGGGSVGTLRFGRDRRPEPHESVEGVDEVEDCPLRGRRIRPVWIEELLSAELLDGERHKVLHLALRFRGETGGHPPGDDIELRERRRAGTRRRKQRDDLRPDVVRGGGGAGGKRCTGSGR